MIRLLINCFNIIIKFLIKIKNYNIIILSKFNLNNEFIKIDIIYNVTTYTQFLSFIKKKFKKFQQIIRIIR